MVKIIYKKLKTIKVNGKNKVLYVKKGSSIQFCKYKGKMIKYNNLKKIIKNKKKLVKKGGNDTNGPVIRPIISMSIPNQNRVRPTMPTVPTMPMRNTYQPQHYQPQQHYQYYQPQQYQQHYQPQQYYQHLPQQPQQLQQPTQIQQSQEPQEKKGIFGSVGKKIDNRFLSIGNSISSGRNYIKERRPRISSNNHLRKLIQEENNRNNKVGGKKTIKK